MSLTNYIQETLEAWGEPSLEHSPDYANAVAELKLKLCEAGHYDLSLSMPVEASKRKVSAIAQFRKALEALNVRPAPVDGELLTVEAAAQLAGVGGDTLLSWIHSKQLRAVNVGKGLQRGRYRIERAALQEFLRFRSTK